MSQPPALTGDAHTDRALVNLAQLLIEITRSNPARAKAALPTTHAAHGEEPPRSSGLAATHKA